MTDWLFYLIGWSAGAFTGFFIGRYVGFQDEKKILRPLIIHLSKHWDERTQSLAEEVVR